MVDHNQERVESIRQREVSDKVNRKLLERAGTRGGERRQHRDGWMGVDFHLLAEGVTFGLGRVERRLHSSSRVLVNLQELDPGASRDVLAAYLQVTSGQGSEGTVDSSINQSK